MNNRDHEYIWNRLCDPVSNLSEAYGRMGQVLDNAQMRGPREQEALREAREETMVLMQDATDRAREIRKKLFRSAW